MLSAMSWLKIMGISLITEIPNREAHLPITCCQQWEGRIIKKALY